MVSGHELKGLMKFAEREEWEDCFGAVLDAHFGPILDAADIEFEDLSEIVDPHWQTVLWGCAFEDFLTLEFDVPGENIVDEYLKRRSWREKPPAKAYMKALRTSIISLYEVSDIVPGSSMKLRDLIRGGEPLTISEKSATQTLKQWDRIAARVVHVRGQTIMAGGVLTYSFKACEKLYDGIRDVLDIDAEDLSKAITDATLQHIAPLFSMYWVADVMENISLRERLNLFNSEGEIIEFRDLRFPFSASVTQKQISQALSIIPDLYQENAKFWNWLETARDREYNSNPNPEDGSQTLNTVLDNGAQVLGTIEIKGKTLILSVNSAGRAERGQVMIERALKDLVKTPLIEIQTFDQMMAEDEVNSTPSEAQLDISPEVAQQIMQQTLDSHYRESLDQPIPALDNKTPRQSVKSKKGKAKVIEWLKYLENRSALSQASDIPMSDYDFTWVWEELGIDRTRL